MAETSKNKIYYNDDENSAADVLADMKKLAQSTDDAIEKSKYNDTQIKKDISNMKTEIAAKNNEQDNKILQLQTEKAKLETELKEAQEDFYQNSIRGQASGEYIHVEDSSNCRAKIGINGNSEQETSPSPDYPSEVESCGDNGSINEVVFNNQMFNKANEIVGQLINSSGVASTNENWNTSEYISVKKGSTICWSYETVGAGQLTINEFNDAKSFIKQTFADYRNNNGNELVVTLSNDTSYVRVGYRNNLTCDNLVLEYGNKRSGSREYKESQTYTIPVQQPMRSVGDTRDTFILKENGKWYERHNIARKIFDGTETFTKETRNEVTNFYMSLEGFGSQKGYCNILPVVNNDSYIANILFIWSNLNGFSMMFDTSRFGTLSDYKSYLKSLYDAGTPAYLDYVLKEPLDIECTEEQSKILDELNNARTYKNVTNIYSTDEISPILSLDYAKDLETLLTSKESEV